MEEDMPDDVSTVHLIAPREEKIRALMNAANAGMEREAETATPAEIFSAWFTLAAVAVQVAGQMGAEPASLRSMAQQLLLHCPEDKGKRVN